MEYGFVYIWYDKKHKRYYIGCHWGDINDGYICSSPWMNKAYNRRPKDFKRRILSLVYTNRKDMFLEEAYWQSFIKDTELKIKYYNIKRHGDMHWSTDINKTISISQKISNTNKEKHKDQEFRAKYEASQKGRDTSWTKDSLVLEKKRNSMKKTMAIKYPEEDRKRYNTKVGTDAHKAVQKELSDRFWKNATDEQLQERSLKISDSLRNSTQMRSEYVKSLRWFNNGMVNVRKKEHPGDGWQCGRIKK